MSTHAQHPVSWWIQFEEASDHLDAAVVTEALADAILPKIESTLLRREAQIAAEVVSRHLNRPASEELTLRSTQAVDRLVATAQRLSERGDSDEPAPAELGALGHVLTGHYAQGAAQAEPYVGTEPLAKAFVAALSVERIDGALTLRLLRDGQEPAMAVRAGLAMGRYAWWPSWLLKEVSERALAGTLDEETIHGLDECAYASLSPVQVNLARKLLHGDEAFLDTSARRLADLGHEDAAVKLREGDLAAVALAARLVSQ